MKRTPILFLLLFLSILSYAQKAKNGVVKFNILRYADEPLPKWVKTYAVKTESTSRFVMVGGPERRMLALKGFEEVENFKDADVQIMFEVHGVNITSDIKEQVKIQKDGDKEVEIKKYYYHVIAQPYGEYLLGLKGKPALSSISFSDYKYEHKSNLFLSYSAAQKAYSSDKESIYETVSRESLSTVVELLAQRANNRYGYYYKEERRIIVTGKGKKFDYTDLDNVQSSFNEGVQWYNQRDYAMYNKISLKCIERWKQILEEYNPNDKKAARKGRINTKIARMIYYNIATAYLYANAFDESMNYIEKGMAVGRSQGLTGRNLLMVAREKRERFKKNQIRGAG